MKIQLELDHVVVFESALYRTTTTLLIKNDCLFLIDPNWLPIEIDFIKNYIKDLAQKDNLYLIFTHSDYDHIIASSAFDPEKRIASKAFVENDSKQKIIKQIQDFDFEYYITRSYPIEYPIIDIEIESDKIIDIQGHPFLFQLAKGHNQDGMMILDQESQILVAGDYLSNVEFPFVYYSFEEYELSLLKFEKLIQSSSVELLIPGHGDYCNSQNEMIKRVKESQDYLQKLKAQGSKMDIKPWIKLFHDNASLLIQHEKNLELLLAKSTKN